MPREFKNNSHNDPCVYVLIDPVTGEIRYVGFTTKKLSQRLKGHIHTKNKYHRSNWIKSLIDQGQIPIIRFVQSVFINEWSDVEKYWIKYFRDAGCPSTNMTDGGDGLVGYVATEEYRNNMSKIKNGHPVSVETRAKISLIHKGRKPHRNTIASRIGSKHTDEAKRKMSISLSNPSIEKRERMRNAQLGKKLTVEHKDKIRVAMTGRVGRKNIPEQKKRISDAMKKYYSNKNNTLTEHEGE